MRKKQIIALATCSVLIYLLGSAAASEKDVAAGTVVDKIATRIRENSGSFSDYGYYQKVNRSKLNNEGQIREQHESVYRTIWILNRPYNELLQVNGTDLSREEKAKESKRLSDFQKAVYTQRKPDGIQEELKSISWWEFRDKYNFSLQPPEPGSAYVLAFQPKPLKLQERNRIERILNQLTGTIWVDEEFNVIKAEATLTKPVRFGLGILAKVEEAQVRYLQQKYGEVWLPSSLYVLWAADIALFRHERQEIRLSWYEPYLRSDKYLISGSVTNELPLLMKNDR